MLSTPFPSPCGVWVVSELIRKFGIDGAFPSPCGVWVVSYIRLYDGRVELVSVPLRGVGCFNPIVGDIVILKFPSPCGVWVVSAISDARPASIQSFRPLAGCGLFRRGVFTRLGAERFRPLAGCGLFLLCIVDMKCHGCFRPLAGCGLFL